ncbi:hypothetical protein [Kushneria marisflavi]|uniref:Uncharacterized protein n=1 Tax=Kushneria marisflavi TaxID=157779 RepID=A0A240UPJ6_9GAMM|nr:hypothetical protein [Kushneria marisflavi]ART62940.1 hypothetical protein B9H00_07625 [Kushneria marisflavi]RKD84836.1 hypothetical protein C8D96_2067 [Kushneria marisflavi]
MPIPDSSSQHASLRWLNTLVVVTLITVTVAIAYLGYYYVGAGNRSQVTWFAPELGCRPLDERCFTALGRFGEMQTQWHYQNGQLSVEMGLGGLSARQVTMQLEETGSRWRQAAVTLEAVSPGHYRGTFDMPLCRSDAHRARGSLVVSTARGLLGSWYDLSLPCK